MRIGNGILDVSSEVGHSTMGSGPGQVVIDLDKMADINATHSKWPILKQNIQLKNWRIYIIKYINC